MENVWNENCRKQDEFSSIADLCEHFELVLDASEGAAQQCESLGRSKKFAQAVSYSLWMQQGPTSARETWTILCFAQWYFGYLGESEFGRPAPLFHSAGKLCIPSECPEVFNHLRHGTCFMYFFRTKCVCMHMSTCRTIPLSVKPFGIHAKSSYAYCGVT